MQPTAEGFALAKKKIDVARTIECLNMTNIRGMSQEEKVLLEATLMEAKREYTALLLAIDNYTGASTPRLGGGKPVDVQWIEEVEGAAV